MKSRAEIRDLIASRGLKITPQRLRVMEAIYELNNHPTAENIIDFVRVNDPNIASGTVYKVLDTLVENKLIVKVKTERDVMRYDGILSAHHHLYCRECDYIEDYYNEKLDGLLKQFFEENHIDNFTIEDIKVSVTGSFIKHKSSVH